MMDAIKNIPDYGTKSVDVLLPDGGEITTLEPIWT